VAAIDQTARIMLVTMIGEAAILGWADHSQMTRKTIDPNKLKPGPIRHEQLPLSLVARINYLRVTLDEVYPQSMEKWLDGFQRDANPGNYSSSARLESYF
jgi:hypothetical protein